MNQEILTVVNNSIVAIITILGAITSAIWFSMIIWTFKDMRSRSRDIFAQILAAVLSGVLPVVGLFVYLLLRPTRTLAETFEMAIEQEVLLQDIEEKRSCPNCKRKAKGNWVLCPHCHVQLQAKCNHCGELKEMAWSMCPACADGVLDPVPQPRIGDNNGRYSPPIPAFNASQEKTILIEGSLVQSQPMNKQPRNGQHVNGSNGHHNGQWLANNGQKKHGEKLNGTHGQPKLNGVPKSNGNGHSHSNDALDPHKKLYPRQSIPNVQWANKDPNGVRQVRLTKRKGLRRNTNYRNGS